MPALSIIRPMRARQDSMSYFGSGQRGSMAWLSVALRTKVIHRVIHNFRFSNMPTPRCQCKHWSAVGRSPSIHEIRRLCLVSTKTALDLIGRTDATIVSTSRVHRCPAPPHKADGSRRGVMGHLSLDSEPQWLGRRGY